MSASRLPPEDPTPKTFLDAASIPVQFANSFDDSPEIRDQLIRTMTAYVKDDRYEFLMVVRPRDALAPILTFQRFGPMTPKGQRGTSLFLSQVSMVFHAIFTRFFDEGPGEAGKPS